MLISIHALHEESDDQGLIGSTTGEISIHALHEESDHWRSARAQALQISIHALHEESDSLENKGNTHAVYFNPRSP